MWLAFLFLPFSDNTAAQPLARAKPAPPPPGERAAATATACDKGPASTGATGAVARDDRYASGYLYRREPQGWFVRLLDWVTPPRTTSGSSRMTSDHLA